MGVRIAQRRAKQARRGDEDRAAQPELRARLDEEPQASRPRPGFGHRQDVGQGSQGHQGARGPPRPGRRQAAFRRRPDADHAPSAEAWLHQSVPRRIQIVRLDDLAKLTR